MWLFLVLGKLRGVTNTVFIVWILHDLITVLKADSDQVRRSDFSSFTCQQCRVSSSPSFFSLSLKHTFTCVIQANVKMWVFASQHLSTTALTVVYLLTEVWLLSLWLWALSVGTGGFDALSRYFGTCWKIRNIYRVQEQLHGKINLWCGNL